MKKSRIPLPDPAEIERIRPVPVLILEVGGKRFHARPEQNPAGAALVEKLASVTVTVAIFEDGGFASAAPLPFDLPRSDAEITAKRGDLLLGPEGQIAVCRDEAKGHFTRVARIGWVTKEDLIAAFAGGAAEAKLFVEWSE